MISNDKATGFARDWIESFNSHQPDAIMMHYAENVEFHSPFIPLLQFNEAGVIHGKEELRRYFEIGLHAYPDLHFRLQHIFTGINSIVICYTSVQEKQAAETFHLDKDGKAVRVYCHYSP